MANQRISDLPNSTPLVGTEAFVMDQESTLTVTGLDTVQNTISAVQEFTLSAAPFINVTGNATVAGTSNFLGRTEMPGARAFYDPSIDAYDFRIDGHLLVKGGDGAGGRQRYSIFGGDIIMDDGNLEVTAGDILSGGELLDDIFAYKGQYIQNGGGVEFIQRLTQAQYDAIGIPDPLILYIIVG